jgi:hypothetical protein
MDVGELSSGYCSRDDRLDLADRVDRQVGHLIRPSLVSVAKCILALKLAGFLRFFRAILLEADVCMASHVWHEAC